jgi:hypothetical protein
MVHMTPLEAFVLLISSSIAFVTCMAGVWMMRYGFKRTQQQTNLLGLKPTIDEGRIEKAAKATSR